MLLITMCDDNILTLLNIGYIYNNIIVNIAFFVLVAWVSCGTGDPSCHDSEDHHDKHGQSGDLQDSQHHRQQLQEWRTEGELGIAFWIFDRRLPTLCMKGAEVHGSEDHHDKHGQSDDLQD